MMFTKLGGAGLKAVVAASILFGSTGVASANACQAGSGCVLPIADAPPPPPPEAAPPIVDAGPVVARRGFPLLAVLVGVTVLGLLAIFLLDDDDETIPLSP